MQLDNVKTLRDAVNYGKQFLEDFGIENAQYDATELLLLVMGISRTQYLINSMDKIDSGKLAEYAELINKRAEHIPLQHITGTVNFYGREYKVNANVLIPRQDTEILVEEVMKLTNSESRVLDMCTGSGCIIISLAASGHTSENGAVAIDISDDALRKSVELQNKISRLIRSIGDYRKEDNPRITGYEFAVLCLATYCCPKEALIEKLEETLEELKTREPDKKCNYRARVVMVGSEIDNPELIKLAEEAGALVVADRFCFGSLPGRDEIILNDTEDVLTQICRQYMKWGQCPRFMNIEKIIERQEYVDAIAKEYKADGLIYQQIKFCDYWGYERASAFHVMKEKYGYPVLSIDRPYAVGTSGQLRTRIQAFVESLEIKRINAGRKL